MKAPHLVFADGHRHNLRQEGGGDFGDLKLGANSLLGLHIEALNAIGSVHLSDELRMERDHDGGGHEYTLRIERTRARHIA